MLVRAIFPRFDWLGLVDALKELHWSFSTLQIQIYERQLLSILDSII